MSNKRFILSSAGLKNVILEPNNKDLFRFKFGEEEIEVCRLFAEFISPYVSHLHQSDPTIDFIDISKIYQKSRPDFFTPDLLSKIKDLCLGNEIDIDEATSHKLRIISILLWNQEIVDQMNKLFPLNFNETNIDSLLQYINYIQTLNNNENNNNSIINQINLTNNLQSLIDIISSNFKTNKNKFLILSKSTIYSLLSNEHFNAQNSDLLFEFINELFEKDDDENCEYSKMDFYEFIDIESLNETNKKNFIDNIDYNQINHEIWIKLKTCFYSQIKSTTSNLSIKSNIKNIEYDDNTNHSFDGIVSYLLKNNETINVTASSTLSGNASNAIDFLHKTNSIITRDVPNSWILYDFKNHKVKPSHYSIMSDHLNSSSPGEWRPQSWVIEGSNDKKNWIELDAHQNDKSLDSQSITKTFKVTNNSKEYFQYLRIRQTGKDTGGCDNLRLSSLEYFGSIIDK